MKKFSIAMALLLLLTMLSFAVALADTPIVAGHSFQSAPFIDLGKTYSAHVDKALKGDFYKFTLAESSYVEFNRYYSDMTGSMNMYVYDANGKQLFYKNNARNSATHMATGEYSTYLKAGTYCVKFGTSSCDMTFVVKATSTHESFPENLTVNNDTAQKANTVTFNREYVGQVGWQDLIDYYSIELTGNEIFDISFNWNAKFANLAFVDSKGKALWKKCASWSAAVEEGFITTPQFSNLPAGKYYIYVQRYNNSYFCKYSFRINKVGGEPVVTATPKPTDEPEVTATPNPSDEPEVTATPKPTTAPVTLTAPKLNSVKGAENGLTIKWGKVQKIDGYEIQLSLKKDFSVIAEVLTAKASATSLKSTGLEGSVRYYVRMRAYKETNGETVYSDWSNAKSALTTGSTVSPEVSVKAPKIANMTTGKDYAGKETYKISADEDLFLTISAENGNGHYDVVAILLNEAPDFTDAGSNQKDHAVAVLYNSTDTAMDTLYFNKSSLQQAAYLKVAVGAYDKNNSSGKPDKWTTVGFQMGEVASAPVFTGKFANKTKTLTLGQSWIVEANVKVSGGSGKLGIITVNSADIQNSTLTDNFVDHAIAEVDLQYWGAYLINTNIAPWNQPGTYTLRLWAKDTDGVGGDIVLDTMELTISKQNNNNLDNRFKEIKKLLPDGYYWNWGYDYVTLTYGNQSIKVGISDKAHCNHPKDDPCTSCQSFGIYNGVPECRIRTQGWGGTQCAGFASMMAWVISGKSCYNATAKKANDSNRAELVDNLEAGDVVRIGNNRHSIVVLKTDEDNVYVVHCNWDHKCGIQWNKKFAKSTLKDNNGYNRLYHVYKYSEYSK